jgi:hypothetical protein
MPNALKQLFTNFPLLVAILLLAFGLRMHRITNEPLDWHAWRQADTASVTREFVSNGINLLEPQYHDLSSIPSGLDNPEGYRMVEFPFINALAALIVQISPDWSVAVVSRLVSVLLSVGTIVPLFFLVAKFSCRKQAYLSAVVFATLPFSVFYGRAILPEPGLLFFSTLSIYAFAEWLSSRSWKWWLTSALSLALALLLKPFALFLGPVYLALLWLEDGKHAWKRWPFLLGFSLVAFVPLLAWRAWIQNFPSGIPASEWLFNGNGIRFRPAWVRWLGYERFVKLILGFSGVLLVLAGFIRHSPKKLLYYSWWMSMALYFTVIATGNVQHDYYQVFALPILSITVAEGMLVLFSELQSRTQKLLNQRYGKQRAHQTKSELLGILTVAALYSSAVLLSWNQVKGYFNTNHTEYLKVGELVDRILPHDAQVIAPAMGDTQFLYQTKRRGWPIGGEIEKKRELGATHYITTTYDDEARELEETYFVIEKTDEHLILDLSRETNS